MGVDREKLLSHWSDHDCPDPNGDNDLRKQMDNCNDSAAWSFKGSSCATALLLTSCGIGSGMLTLPRTLQESGPRVGIILMLIGFVLSSISTMILLSGSSRLHLNTFGGVIDCAVGFKVSVCGIPLMDSIFFVYLFACTVSFLLFLGDFLPSAIDAIAGEQCLSRTLSICVCALVLGSLTIVNRMNVVRHVASLGLLAVLCTAAVVMVKAATLIPEQIDAVNQAWDAPMRFSWGTMHACGNVIFSFCIGGNVPAIAVEMRQPSTRNIVFVSVFANCAMLVFYAAIAYAAFFSFVSSGVAQDFTQSYPKRDPSMTMCRAMLIFTMLAVASLNLITGMKCFYAVLGALLKQPEDWEPRISVRAVCVGVISGLCALVAVFFKDVNILVSWLGAFIGAPEMLLAPLLLLYARKVGNLSGPVLAMVVIPGVLCLVFLWIVAITDMAA